MFIWAGVYGKPKTLHLHQYGNFHRSQISSQFLKDSIYETFLATNVTLGTYSAACFRDPGYSLSLQGVVDAFRS